MPAVHERRADLTIPGHWRKRSLLAIFPATLPELPDPMLQKSNKILKWVKKHGL
jgi:hypothetical protein